MENRKKGNLKVSFGPSRRRQPQVKRDDLIFGTRAIIEAIKAGKEIDKLFLQKGLNNELTLELAQLAAQRHIPILRVPIEKIDRITRKNHQGAVCFLSAVTYASLDNIVSECFQKGKTPFLLLLDRVTDVRNFGAVARSAECAGIDAVVIPGRGSAQINSDAMKTSAGALNFIPVCREDNLKDTIRYLKDSGIQILACTEKADKLIYETDLKAPLAILLGSEEDGVSPEYLKMVDMQAKIPVKGNIASLNVSVATGVVIYEALRQRSSLQS